MPPPAPPPTRAPSPSPVRRLNRISNPPNPWHSAHVDYLGEPPRAALETFEDSSRSILSRNESPDIPFTFSVNPYRGCFHGCAYCYARPTHEYLDFGAGTDFERKITFKSQAPALLQRAFDKPSWVGDLVAFSGVTDCYQPLEASLGLTRGCLEVCLEYRNPVSIITKSPLIERDLGLLAELSRAAFAVVVVSLGFWDADNARAVEPWVASPRRRVETIRRLAEAGIPVGVNVSPIIPGLNDTDIVRVLEESRRAGASFAGQTLIRLPGPVREVFIERLRKALPLRASRVLSQIRECRDGDLNEPRFNRRMGGSGERWKAVHQLFKATERRLGFGEHPRVPMPTPFRRPGQQLTLL